MFNYLWLKYCLTVPPAAGPELDTLPIHSCLGCFPRESILHVIISATGME